MSFEVGKTYISTEYGYVLTFRVDYIQSILGVPDAAVGVSNPGDPDEEFDYVYVEDFEETGWREL